MLLRKVAIVVFLVWTAREGFAGNQYYTRSYDDAIRRAKSEDKYVLVFLGATDWTERGKRFKQAVLVQPVFQEWAGKKVIFLWHELPNAVPTQAEQKTKLYQLFAKNTDARWHVNLLVILKANEEQVGFMDHDALHKYGWDEGADDYKFIEDVENLLGPLGNYEITESIGKEIVRREAEKRSLKGKLKAFYEKIAWYFKEPETSFESKPSDLTAQTPTPVVTDKGNDSVDVVTLKNGQTLNGKITSRDEQTITIQTQAGAKVILRQDEITDIRQGS